MKFTKCDSKTTTDVTYNEEDIEPILTDSVLEENSDANTTTSSSTITTSTEVNGNNSEPINHSVVNTAVNALKVGTRVLSLTV